MVAEDHNDGGDVFLPLSRLFPRRRPASSPRHGPSFSAGDLVWAKAFPYTWWPGRVYRLKPSAALVCFFGGEKARWLGLSKLRAFEDHYVTISRMARAKLAAEINLAVEELGRRTMMGLACPCRRSVVGSGDISNRIMDQVKGEFAPVDVMEFIRTRAVHVWTTEKEEASPRFIRLAAGALAFRRSLVYVESDKELDAGRLLKMVLASAVDVWIGNAGEDDVCKMVEEVTAYRRFVSRVPDWVVQELSDSRSGLSRDDELGETCSDEEVEASFSGSSGEESEETDISRRASGSYSQTLFDRLPKKEDLSDHLDESATLVNFASHGIWAVNQPTEIEPCSLNAISEDYDMCMDPSLEDAEYVPEGECASSLNTFLGDCSEACLRESVVPNSNSGTVLEFENTRGSCASCPGVCNTKENIHFLQEAINKLHILASDPCHCMKESYKNSYENLLRFRALLFLDTRATESTGVVSASHVSETSYMLSVEGKLPDFIASSKCSPCTDEVALCKDTTSISTYPSLTSAGYQFCTLKSDQAFQFMSDPKTEAGQHVSVSASPNHLLVSENGACHDAGSINCYHEVEGREMLENIHLLAVDPFYLGPRNLKSLSRKFLRFRKLAFLNILVVHGAKRRLEIRNEDTFVKKLQVDNILETSHAEMDKMHDSAVVNVTCCASDSLSKVTADNMKIEHLHRHFRDKEPTDVQCQSGINVLAETSEHADGSCNLKPAPDSSGASVFDAASLKKGTSEESVASGNIETPQAMVVKPGIDLNATCRDEIARACPNDVYDLDVGVNPLSSNFDSLSNADNHSIRANFQSRMVKSQRTIPSPHSLKRSPDKKRRLDSISLYQPKLHKNQSRLSIRQFYASPLLAETSKPALKVKSIDKARGTDLCKILHMKFPKNFKLPSKEELERKFRVFGQLDRTRTKIFYYTGAAEIVFLKANDAQAAFTYASRKKVFTHVDVRFWFDEHERFRMGNRSASLPSAPGESSLNLKSCLRKPDMQKEEERRRGQKVKFSANFRSSQITSNKDSLPESVPQDDIPSENDISGRMLRLLVRCDEVVNEIKRNLGLDSYYSIFVHAYDLPGTLEWGSV